MPLKARILTNDSEEPEGSAHSITASTPKRTWTQKEAPKDTCGSFKSPGNSGITTRVKAATKTQQQATKTRKSTRATAKNTRRLRCRRSQLYTSCTTSHCISMTRMHYYLVGNVALTPMVPCDIMSLTCNAIIITNHNWVRLNYCLLLYNHGWLRSLVPNSKSLALNEVLTTQASFSDLVAYLLTMLWNM